MNKLPKIPTADLVPLNVFEEKYPVSMEAVYSNVKNPDNHFKNLYHARAKIIWAHKDLAEITLVASKICSELYGWTLQVNDCLRPVEAQEKMAEYGYDSSLVSLPGSGGHPRAMAIDIQPIDTKTGEFVEMGTPFDYFSDDPKADNPAARDYEKFGFSIHVENEIMLNRSKLEFAMRKAAIVVGKEIVPLPQEWWDFRFPQEVSGQYAPFKEADLQPYQRLIKPDLEGVEKILAGQYPDEVKSTIETLERNVIAFLKKLDFSNGGRSLPAIPFKLDNN